MRICASSRTETRLARSNTERCREMAGRETGKCPAMSLTFMSDAASIEMMLARTGSARAAKASMGSYVTHVLRNSQATNAARSAQILLVADLLEPFDDLAVLCFLDGNVSHRCRRRGAVPMFLSGRTADDVAGTDLDLLLAPALRPAESRRDDQRLAAGMGVPRRACAGLERHARAREFRRTWRLEQGIDPHCAGEGFGRSPDGSL